MGEKQKAKDRMLYHKKIQRGKKGEKRHRKKMQCAMPALCCLGKVLYWLTWMLHSTASCTRDLIMVVPLQAEAVPATSVDWVFWGGFSGEQVRHALGALLWCPIVGRLEVASGTAMRFMLGVEHFPNLVVVCAPQSVVFC